MEKWMDYANSESPLVGGFWTSEDPVKFAKEHEHIIIDAVAAIKLHYKLDGYTFSKVLNVSQQVADGFNYEVITEFTKLR